LRRRGLLYIGIGSVTAALLIGIAGALTPGGLQLMGLWAAPPGSSISIDDAQKSVQSFLGRTGDGDLEIDELMEFDQNFYALIREKSTRIGAFELLVDKHNGNVRFEPGPNMMWNTKYSTMGGGGMMNGGGGMMPWFRVGSSPASMSVSADEATQIAQRWLDQEFNGDSAATADALYGYYTFHFVRDGRIAGMLSVNGFSGQVWYHSWHGGFIQVRDFGA
jgi:hypothetical protein